MHRWMACLIVLVVVASSSAKTLEEVEKAVTEAMDQHKSVRCKVEMVQDINTGMFKSKTLVRGTLEFKKGKEDLHRSRMEMKGKMSMEVMGNAQQQPMEMLMIDDGQYQYTMMVTGQRRTAIKGRRDPNNALGGKQFFKLQREMATLKLLPDEKAGEVDCYAIEATPKRPMPMFARSVTHISKKTGIARKMTIFDKQGKETMTVRTSDIRLNVDIPDDRFVFKVPAGVTLRDMTKLPSSRPASRPAGPGMKENRRTREPPDLEAILKRLQEQKKQRNEQEEKK